MEAIALILILYLVVGSLYGRSLTGKGENGDDNLGPF